MTEQTTLQALTRRRIALIAAYAVTVAAYAAAILLILVDLRYAVAVVNVATLFYLLVVRRMDKRYELAFANASMRYGCGHCLQDVAVKTKARDALSHAQVEQMSLLPTRKAGGVATSMEMTGRLDGRSVKACEAAFCYDLPAGSRQKIGLKNGVWMELELPGTAAHTVLASQFLNEAFAKDAGMREEQMGLGHAFEMDPAVENTFLYELAQAQMAREIFPNAPLKYMPPTKFMTGNIFRGHIQDALFNMVTILTNQRLCLLGMMTEAIHTPFMSDRALSIENAQYIFRTMKDLGSELTYKENGIIRNRANEVLTKATDLLKEIEKLGLFTTIEKGIFADVKRPKDGGKGLAGVVVKDDKYFKIGRAHV